MPNRPADYRVTRSTVPESVSTSGAASSIRPSPDSCEPGLFSRVSSPLRSFFAVPPATHLRAAVLPRVSALFAASPTVSTWRGSSPTPTMFRPQVFSTSRRVTPPPAARAYCIPQPRPGFSPFRGFSRSTAAPTRRRFVPPCRCHPSAHRRTGCHPRMIRLRGVAPWTDAFLRVGGWPSLRSLPSSVSSSFRFSLPDVDPVPRGLHS
jgi:hypothetical protein